ncbi:hypothetical protein F5884DRAFT_387470 [Xylogone sp. PMI_703]|nr:hypothetical protein F5884DRAFT_387470 [Xylogone sp. PMI_703]
MQQPMPPDWLRQWKRRHAGEEWGFVAARTCCYDDEERWSEFKIQFQKIVDIPFERERDHPDVAEARAKFRIVWIEDPDLDSASIQALQERYAAIKATLPPGLSHPVFLSTSPDVITSVLSATSSPPSVDSQRWRPSAPYIIAVAASSDPGLDEGHEERSWFREAFKVAVEVLVDEFWLVIDLDMMPLRRITRGIRGVNQEPPDQDERLEEMWWSMAPSPAKLRRRRGGI